MKILVIRLSSMGDIILTTPVLRALKASYPDAIIDFAVKKQFAPLLEYNTSIHRLLILDTHRESLRELKREIKENGYTLILDLHRNFRSYYLKTNSGAQSIKTLRKNYIRRFFLISLHCNFFGKKPLSIIDKYAHTAKDHITTPISHCPEIFIPKAIYDQLQPKREKWTTPIIVMIPRAAHKTKEWSPHKFGEVGKILAKERNASVIILSGPQKDQKNSSIQTMIGRQSLDFTGQTTLLETAAIINIADLVITVDTGCMHMGLAFKKRMICIFGSTTKELGYYPQYDNVRIIENNTIHCRPCSHNGHKSCPKAHFRCMKEITVKMVIKAANELLGPKKGLNLTTTS